MKKSLYLVFLISAFSFNAAIAADNNEENSYYNEYPKHGIDLRISFWDHSKGGANVNLNGLSIDVGTGGVSGKLMYNFYSSPELAFTFSVGIMSAKVNVETFSSYTSTVSPVMMGLKYFFMKYDTNNALRPYVSGSFGMLVGTESGVKLPLIGTSTETTIGASAGFGTDIILGSVLKLNADIGYNLFSDFSEEIGGKKNYSGAEFSFGIGFMF
jgi:hypothetical protein